MKPELSPCNYPTIVPAEDGSAKVVPCSAPVNGLIELPIYEAGEEKAVLTGEKFKAPFCKYHGILARSGRFMAFKNKESGQPELVGQFDEVDLVETVVNAMALAAEAKQ